MPINTTLLLATHLDQPAIVPATAGWDARINDYIEYLRFDTFEGCLARAIGIAPTTSSSGTVILTVPAGYSAFVTKIIAVRDAATPTGTFTIGTQATTPNNWNNAGFSLSALSSAASPVVILPYVSGEVLGNAPKALPIIDGDGSTPTLKIQRTSGSSIAFNMLIFGTVWRN